MRTRIPWWQVALAAVALSAIGGLSARHPKSRQRKLYNQKLKQAPWAPPAWLFGPAWTFNNVFVLMALLRILRSQDPSKKTLLFQQLAIWFIFFSFGYVYFKKQSSILALLWTAADATLAISSMLMALRSDKRLAADYLPLVVWTSFASTVAGYQAVKNADPLLGTPALL